MNSLSFKAFLNSLINFSLISSLTFFFFVSIRFFILYKISFEILFIIIFGICPCKADRHLSNVKFINLFSPLGCTDPELLGFLIIFDITLIKSTSCVFLTSSSIS